MKQQLRFNKAVANWIINEVFVKLKEIEEKNPSKEVLLLRVLAEAVGVIDRYRVWDPIEVFSLVIRPQDLAELVWLEVEGKVSHHKAKKVLDIMWDERLKALWEICEARGLIEVVGGKEGEA